MGKMAFSFSGKFSQFSQYNRKLLLLKFVLFFTYAGALASWTYLPLILTNVGLSMEESSFIFTILPLTNIPANAVAGVIGDKLGSYRGIMIVTCVMYVVAFNAVLLVPRIAEPIPPSLKVHCTSLGTTVLATCPSESTCPSLPDVMTLVTSLCDYNCDNDVTKDFINETVASFDQSDVDLLSTNVTLSLKRISGCEYATSFANESVMTCSSCDVKCAGILDGGETALCRGEGAGRFLVFALMFAIILVTSIFAGVSFTMHDACVFAMMKQYDGDYGKHRMCGMLGRFVAPPIVGWVVDVVSDRVGYVTYAPAFILSDIIMGVSVVLMCFLDVKPEKPQPNVMKNMWILLKRVDVDVIMVVILLLGTAWGFLSVFLVWHVSDLGGSKMLVGLCGSVASAVGIPFLFTSDSIIKKVGSINVIAISCLSYGVRLVAYAYMQNPWWAILWEALGEIFCIHLFWIAASTYGTGIAGDNLRATMLAFIRALHFYLGRSLGSFLGGLITEKIGIRGAFKIVGLAISAIGIIFWVVEKVIIVRLYPQAPIPEGGKEENIGEGTEVALKQVAPLMGNPENPQQQQAEEETKEQKRQLERRRSSSVPLAPYHSVD